LEQAQWMLASMFGSISSAEFRLPDHDVLITLVVVECLVIAHWLCRNTPLETVAVRVPWWSVSLALALMLVAITLSSGESQSYLYFQY
jgi:alginate O-acetyltransferase complex protein AlgI